MIFNVSCPNQSISFVEEKWYQILICMYRAAVLYCTFCTVNAKTIIQVYDKIYEYILYEKNLTDVTWGKMLYVLTTSINYGYVMVL